MKLYALPPSQNTRRVRAVIHHLGLNVELIPVDFSKGQNKTPEYLALNPNGKVPTFVDGDLVIWESNAINVYLCEKVGETELYPSDPKKKAIVNQWLDWQMCHFGPACDTLQTENLMKPMFWGQQTDPARVQDGEERFHRFANVLDKHLANRKFVAAEHVTLADFAIAANLTYIVPAKMPIEPYTNVIAWNERINEIESFKKSASF